MVTVSVIRNPTPYFLDLLTPVIITESTYDKNSSYGPDVPENFAKVMNGIYRCSFPQENHLQALNGLRLKTVVLVLSPFTLGFSY